MGPRPIEGKGVPLVSDSLGSESVFSSKRIGNTMSSRSSWQPSTDNSIRLIDKIVDEHRSSRQQNSSNGDIAILLSNIADNLLVEGLVIQFKSLSLIVRDVAVEV